MQTAADSKAFSDPVSRVALHYLLVNLCLIGIKVVHSHLFGSLALRADAVHSLVTSLE